MNDLYLIILTGFFVYYSTKFINYYYNFYHIYRYLDSSQKLGYFKNISLIYLLNKYEKVKKILIFYILVPAIKFNYLLISLFVSLLYSLCEDDFKDYLEKRNVLMVPNKQNQTNQIESDNNLKLKNLKQPELIINHDYLESFNKEQDNNLKISYTQSDDFNLENDNYKNNYSSSDSNLNQNNKKVKLTNTGTNTNTNTNTNTISNTRQIELVSNTEITNQYELNMSNELGLLGTVTGTKTINSPVIKYNNIQEEDIDNYIVKPEIKFNQQNSMNIINKNNFKLKPRQETEETPNIIETIRIDEIDFGENIANVLDNKSTQPIQSTQSTQFVQSTVGDKKTKEIKIVPIKIGKKKN